MSRESIVFLVGICIFLMPHLGVPADWKFYFYLVAGVICMLCGYTLRRSAYMRSIQESNGERHADSFSESMTTREKVANDRLVSQV